MNTGWQKTSELTKEARMWLNQFLSDYPTLRFYFHAAIEDLGKGVDNRRYLIGQQKIGLMNRIFFDDSTISTTAGTLSSDDTLVATGGTIAISEQMKACHIGNFLTPPQHRGNGYARRVAATLSRHLFGSGITNIMLGTTRDNVAARRVYESLGFKTIDHRVQLDLARST
ncbi:MAG: hypothetical protein A2428_02600 [Bdellovibrionales bacterium RIFOXYC1_FULL_54_43]|nr:MAG: hypothetical protein A2428_02600 [Bdellovibrionales bacterium RIFOXYC1_FULL_54_43]OFZ82576.1 MAG: hypothetical protein A2603_15055 [Bdellovibrionales bacterium RIFOXYD1_FULL_55_31]